MQKLMTSGLKYSTSSCLLIVPVSQILLHLLWPGGWLVTSEVQISQFSSSAILTQKLGMGLVIKLQIMQQLTILVTFFQIRRL